MSWDVVIIKIRGEFRPLDDVETEDYLPLGSMDEVQTAIRSAFPSAEWVKPDQAVYTGPDYDIVFKLDAVESSDSIMLHVYGTGDPITSLLKLSEANGWVLLDCSTTEFISPMNPSDEGWEGYKTLVERNPEKES